MKLKLLAFVFLFGISSHLDLSAQLNPCGTPSYKSDWLKAYQKNPNAYETRSGVVIYVPLTIHLVTPDGGSGGAFPTDQLLEALCTLNDDFAETELQFYIKDEIRILQSSLYNTHTDILTGAQMMFENNVENTINCYIMDVAAGNCGYNLPYAGVALAEMCTGPDDHTWAHEIGHNLSLPHPFIGWEGGVSYDGTVAHSFSDPAPEIVTYDYTLFQDTLILDTLIIDTAIVEKVDGSNCHIAADGFCDTTPDYLAYRWDCAGQPESTVLQHDPDNIPFRSDATLIMGYALDACSNRFTPEQSAAARANLIDEKPGYIADNYQAMPISASEVLLDSPFDEEIIHYEGIQIDWEPVENADYYLFTLYNTNPVFPGQLLAGFSELVTSNALAINMLANDKTYVWEVEAISNGFFCETIISEQRTFHTSNISSVVDVDTDHSLISIRPNLTSQGSKVIVESKTESIASLHILDAQGRHIRNISNVDAQQVDLLTTDMNAGLYFLRVTLNDRRTVVKRMSIY